jgi:hypothetical protein
MSSDKETNTEAGSTEQVSASEGDPPIIVHSQEGDPDETEGSASEGDPPIIVQGA